MNFYKEWQKIRNEKELNNCISTEFKLNSLVYATENPITTNFLEDDILFLPQSMKASVQIKFFIQIHK